MTKKNPIFIITTGFIIAIGRLSISNIGNSKGVILIVMAIVNYVALGFVLLFLCLDIDNYCCDKIDNAGIETKIKRARKGKRNFISSIVRILLLLLYLIIGYLYVDKFRSENINDIISIVALSISIASNGLVGELGNLYYKLVINLSTEKSKTNNKEQKN